MPLLGNSCGRPERPWGGIEEAPRYRDRLRIAAALKANSLWRTAITVGGTRERFTHAIPPAPLAATLFWHVPRPRRYRELCRKRVNENDSGEVSPCLAESVKACADRVPRLVVVGVPANLGAVRQSRDGDLGPDGPRELVAGPAELQRRWPGGLWPGPPAELPPQRAEPIGHLRFGRDTVLHVHRLRAPAREGPTLVLRRCGARTRSQGEGDSRSAANKV